MTLIKTGLQPCSRDELISICNNNPHLFSIQDLEDNSELNVDLSSSSSDISPDLQLYINEAKKLGADYLTLFN
jgi:hypothetical protein